MGNNYDILWIDKGWIIRPSTLKAIKSKVGVIVLFNNDNPWGEHERGLWRLHLKIVPLVHEVMTPRYSGVRPYELAGARRVSVVDFGFAPERHFPPSGPVKAEHDISFIGTALRDGGGFGRTGLHWSCKWQSACRAGSACSARWRRALRGQERLFAHVGPGVWGDGYRTTIWASRVSLAFITKDNWDELSHRALEITACGGCLLAERASRLEQSFREDAEAVYFSNIDEMVAKAVALLEDETRRQAIAQAGLRRACGSGYDNVARLRDAIDRSPLLRPFFLHLRDDNAAFTRGASRVPDIPWREDI